MEINVDELVNYTTVSKVLSDGKSLDCVRRNYNKPKYKKEVDTLRSLMNVWLNLQKKENMETLFKRHFEVIKNRGGINPEYSFLEYTQKLNDEFCGMQDALIDLLNDFTEENKNKFFQETIDLVSLTTNLAQSVGMNLKEELEKNVIQ